MSSISQTEMSRRELLRGIILELGGEASTSEIATRAGINSKDVSSTLCCMYKDVVCLEGRKETRWKLCR